MGLPAHDRTTLAAVGYLHESQAFPSYLGARTLLEYYGGLSQVSRDELHRRIPRLLDQVGLTDRAAEPISTLQQRNGPTPGLWPSRWSTTPQLLVLDEPSEGMDLVARKVLYDVIRRCKQEEKNRRPRLPQRGRHPTTLRRRVALLRDGVCLLRRLAHPTGRRGPVERISRRPLGCPRNPCTRELPRETFGLDDDFLLAHTRYLPPGLYFGGSPGCWPA